MGKKMKVTFGKNWDVLKEERKCIACNGSGYYDTSIKGRTPKCASCDGTGVDETKV